MVNRRTIILVLATLIAASLLTTARAQEISIVDPGLDTAIREALQKLSRAIEPSRTCSIWTT